MQHLILIADYGDDDLASTEAVLATRRQTTVDFTVDVVATRPFNTIHTAFLLDQLHRGVPSDRGSEYTFFLNTDPRTQTEDGVHAAEGAPLVIATLDSGVRVVTPNAGLCLSLVRNRITSLALAHCDAAGSQFRSRDLFPTVVAAILNGDTASVTGNLLSIERVPTMPPDFVLLHTDNYGNMKTSFTARDREKLGLTWGAEVQVHFAGKSMRVPVVENIFAKPAGTLVFAPGSSGDPANPFFEFSLRYSGNCTSSAASIFGNPEPGSDIEFQKNT
ncbi:MAG: hypothetical protein ABIG71_02865 [Candidatus Uhrbacteria bacterium]